ncbi:hypothetical protein AADG42_19125 [Ammonicoccus fulvus]|uniref:Uncharacterized protein n=1 Tax=Ammonicoccus fulvus TaxID=3138240 RepID=A0ABZ3FVD6_9ACTN
MKSQRYEGPFVTMIGEEDLLQPTPRRIGWLLMGLVLALVFGFAVGLAWPRKRRSSLAPRQR